MCSCRFYTFTFVRNPWDRIVSEYHWRLSLPKQRPPTNFSKFVEYCGKRLQNKNNIPHDIYWTHAQLQKSYITDQTGNVIIDQIYKFEHLQEAIEDLNTKLNMSIAIKQYNSSTHDHYREYYNDRDKAKVAKLYKEDIELFEYEF